MINTENIKEMFKELCYNDLSINCYGLNLENAYKEILKENIKDKDLIKKVYEDLKKIEKDTEKDYNDFRFKEMLNNLEKDLKYKFKIFLKTFQKDKRDFLKCCEICLNNENKTDICLYFRNLKTNRKSKKFIEIEKEFIPFLYSFKKDKIYKILEDILNKIEGLK